MRRLSTLLFVGACVALVAATWVRSANRPRRTVPVDVAGGRLPTSNRATGAIRRVRPALERDVRAAGFEWGAAIFVRIVKEPGVLEVWLEREGRFALFRSYDICTFSGGLGPKKLQGDGKSPEGFYFVRPERMHPTSRYHLAFNLGYPNAYDRHHGYTGDFLMVHGDCVSIGCYAMTDAKIEEIYALADAAFRAGQPFFRAHLFPFEPTPAALTRHRDSPSHDFWTNLAEGWAWFERERRPPDVTVVDGRYVFGHG